MARGPTCDALPAKVAALRLILWAGRRTLACPYATAIFMHTSHLYEDLYDGGCAAHRAIMELNGLRKPCIGFLQSPLAAA